MTFRDYYSRQQFADLFQERADNEANDTKNAVQENLFYQALTHFLIDLKKSGHSFYINYSAGHQTNFSHKWPQVLDTPEAQNAVERLFYPIYSMSTFKSSKRTEDETYEALIKLIDTGNISHYGVSQEGNQCFECGQRFQLNFKNWGSQYQIFSQKEDGSLDYSHLVTPKPCLLKEAVEVEINFPTGEILVSDWFRIDELRPILKDEREYEEHASINHAAGRIYTTKRYAELFNLVCVSVGNSSPNVFLDKTTGHITVGRPHYDSETDEESKPPKHVKEIANVCTDFWGVSMIDKSELIRILSDKYPETAESIVNDYINSSHNNLEIINITPGKYTLQFHGNYHKFHDMVEHEEGVVEDIQAVFMLRAKDLVLKKKKKLSV